MPAWAGWLMVLAGLGFFVPCVVVPPHRRVLLALILPGVVIAVCGVKFLAERVTVLGSDLVDRGVFISTVVALDRLRYAGALRAGGRVPHWKLRLCDESGNTIDVNFDGFPAASRTRLLAALEPWVVAAPGVRVDGPIDRALAGDLWWPKTKAARARARAQKEWRRQVHRTRAHRTRGAHERV